MDGGNMTKYSDELLELVLRDKEYDKLLEICYSNSGNMNGNIDRIIIDPEKLLLTTEQKENIEDPLQVKEYKITEENLKTLLDQIEEYNFPMWNDLEMDESMIALDAPTEGIRFLYNNSEKGGHEKEFYNVGFADKMPDDAREALRDFRKSIKSFIIEENKIQEYVKEED